eukprot:9481658-Pyramimonas_sp.AAC.1
MGTCHSSWEGLWSPRGVEYRRIFNECLPFLPVYFRLVSWSSRAILSPLLSRRIGACTANELSDTYVRIRGHCHVVTAYAGAVGWPRPTRASPP